jgi:hypothetical protein
MEEIYEELKGTLIVHDKYQGVVCGYTEGHFILAVETKEVGKFFRVLKKDFFVEEAYKDPKYRYILEDERTIVKQKKIWQQKNLQ